MNYRVLRVDVTDSTQELARGIRRERTVVVARQMTAGRGRMGHSWLAEPGGLWFTVILSSPLGELLSLAAGSALAASLSHFGIDACLKWPNDVLVNSKKIAGILLESRDARVFLGVGVNLLNLVSGKVEGAVSACELGYAVSPDALLPVFLSELDARSVMRSNELVEEWKEWQCIIGKMVEVNDGAVYRGIAVDVDMNGFLIVESDGKRRRVVAGDVRIIRTEGAARPDL